MSTPGLQQIPQMTRPVDWPGSTEPALMPELPIIDPHHHFSEHWGGYGPAELLSDIATGHNVRATVYIQCGHAYRASGETHLRPVGETEAVVAAVDAPAPGASAPRIAAGIVGYVDLLLGDAVEDVLVAHIAAGSGRFRGVRNVAGRHDAFQYGMLARPLEHLYAQPQFRRAVARLARHGLTFDALVYHTQLDEVTALARDIPEVTVVLNHVGLPLGVGPYEGRRSEAMAEWKAAMARLATCPNVYVKLGGLGMPVSGSRFHEHARPPGSEELAQQWRPAMEASIEMFGAQRCMFESNFPVDRAACNYSELWNAFKRIAKDASAAEKALLFHDTAARVYRLQV